MSVFTEICDTTCFGPFGNFVSVIYIPVAVGGGGGGLGAGRGKQQKYEKV